MEENKSAVPLMAKEEKNNDIEAAYNPTFTPAQSPKDGVGEVRIAQPAPKFIGLSKEELEKYRDDPFWKRLRLALFVIFCVSWVAMFVAAIVIVVQSPPCPTKFKPLWWQTKLNYQIWTPRFRDSDGNGKGDLGGVTQKLDALNRIGVESIWPTPLLEGSETQPGYSVHNHTVVDPSIGGNDALNELISKAHGKDMYVVIDFPLTTTSKDHQWFQTNPQEYYVTSTAAGDAAYWGTTSVGGVTVNYLHVKDSDVPVLDWTKDPVKQYMQEALNHWMNAGVDGFYLGYVDYMARTANGQNPDWAAIQQNVQLVREWVTEFETENEKIDHHLLYSSVAEAGDGKDLVGETGLDYIINKQMTTIATKDPVDLAKQLHAAIQPTVENHANTNDSWPYWELGNPYVSRVCSRTGEGTCELVHMLMLSLPGAVNVYYGDELGMTDIQPQSIDDANANKTIWLETPQRGLMQWTGDNEYVGFSSAQNLVGLVPPAPNNYNLTNYQSETNAWRSMLKTFKKFAEIRNRRESFYGGDMRIEVQGPLITYSRHPGDRAGDVTFYGALNFGTDALTVSFGEYNATGSAEVVAVSSNIQSHTPRDKGIDLSGFELGPLQGLLLKVSE